MLHSRSQLPHEQLHLGAPPRSSTAVDWLTMMPESRVFAILVMVTSLQLAAVCEGFGTHTRKGSTTPPKKCTNTPGFKDAYGSCATYRTNKWCTRNGDHHGASWQSAWGQIEPKVVSACCACGKRMPRSASGSETKKPTAEKKNTQRPTSGTKPTRATTATSLPAGGGCSDTQVVAALAAARVACCTQGFTAGLSRNGCPLKGLPRTCSTRCAVAYVGMYDKCGATALLKQKIAVQGPLQNPKGLSRVEKVSALLRTCLATSLMKETTELYADVVKNGCEADDGTRYLAPLGKQLAGDGRRMLGDIYRICNHQAPAPRLPRTPAVVSVGVGDTPVGHVDPREVSIAWDISRLNPARDA